ncbi:MAG: DNA-processing protein DprA [Planctomycetota bacterium]|jgi:DNA processing protein
MARQQPNSTGIESWLKLIRADGVGPAIFGKLMKRFGSVERILGASVSELAKANGLGFKTAERIAATRDKFDPAPELELAQRLGVWIVNLEDERYPPVLRRIYDPPPVLYIKGSLIREDNLGLSIVGSRQCSTYGREQSSRFAHFLGAAGFTICSGMARGIDTAAHQGALSAGGRTIAVQGCGLAGVFPPENKKLFEMISESGACVSELPLRYEPLRVNFPPRNRIIAGLSLGTIVIEAAHRSGALITARAALDYDREVMAVPGRIDSPLNRGAHQLIKQGARLIESVEDVTEALGQIGEQLAGHASAAAANAAERAAKTLFDASQLKLSDAERKIYDCLSRDPLHVEQIITQTNLAPGVVNATLISMRLKGLIKQLPGSMFAKG